MVLNFVRICLLYLRRKIGYPKKRSKLKCERMLLQQVFRIREKLQLRAGANQDKTGLLNERVLVLKWSADPAW